jgi:hypothetical protein
MISEERMPALAPLKRWESFLPPASEDSALLYHSKGIHLNGFLVNLMIVGLL